MLSQPHGDAVNASNTGIVRRAQGCLIGQIAGDSLGSLVEFQSAEAIRRRYASGVRLLAGGGTWGTLAGQPTDDSELALALARSLAALGRYDDECVATAYARWYDSDPFDIGGTTATALSAASGAVQAGQNAAAAARAAANQKSQANGALMRISPLGIFGVRLEDPEIAALARLDASLTHPHPVCGDANAIFASALSLAIRSGQDRECIYQHALSVAAGIDAAPEVVKCVEAAESHCPEDYTRQQGWALKALQNAFYQLLHAPSLEEGVVDTVNRGGDTDTNATIAGALLGAVWGIGAIPQQWLDSILNCRPEPGRAGVRHPRPEEYWPVDALDLARRLLPVDA